MIGGDPLILETARRVLPLCGGYENILVASGRHLVEPTAAILTELPFDNLLVEPTPRNTAPAIGWAAARIARTDPDAVVMVLPSDHHIADVPGFQATLERAVASARSGAITTIGIRPTHPETGYGYIEMGDAHAGGGLSVKRFVEKPHLALAEELLATGRHLWNAGMFIFRARDMMDAIRAHQPALAEGLDAFDRAAAAGDELTEVLQRFPTLPSVSIDKGVMEHMTTLAVLPGDFRLERHRQLAERVGAGREGRRGERRAARRGVHRIEEQPGRGPAQRRAREAPGDRARRRGEPRRGGDGRRAADRAARAVAGCEGDRRCAQGAGTVT